LNYKSGDRWVSVSSDEMLKRAKLIAAGLHALGVRRGDRVALLSDSRV
jgi:long-subunit acyl-CoA synthetase (AMP-forming)